MPDRAWRSGVWAAVALWAGLRALSITAVALSPARGHRSVLSLLTGFDGAYYIDIAVHGYDHGPTDGDPRSSLAFHPLLPWLIRAAHTVGIPATPAALAIAAAAGVAAAAVLYHLGRAVSGPRAGMLTVVLWAVLPHAVVQSMAYTETMFTLAAAGTMLLLMRHRWVWAGVVCGVSGLIRPTATALVGTVAVLALMALVRRQHGFGPLIAAALAPAGLLGYWAWVAARVQRVDGWFWVQATGWHTHFDGGQATVGQVVASLMGRQPMGYVVTSVVVVAAGVATVWAVADRRIPVPVRVYALLMFVMVAGAAGSYHSKGRLLIPAVVMLLPAAAALAAARPRTAVIIVVAAATASHVYGAYLLTVWHLSP